MKSTCLDYFFLLVIIEKLVANTEHKDHYHF